MISEINELSLDAYTVVRYLPNSIYGLGCTMKKRATLLQCSSVLGVQHTVLDRPILGSKFSRKFNIHNCYSHLVSGTEWKGRVP